MSRNGRKRLSLRVGSVVGAGVTVTAPIVSNVWKGNGLDAFCVDRLVLRFLRVSIFVAFICILYKQIFFFARLLSRSIFLKMAVDVILCKSFVC